MFVMSLDAFIFACLRLSLPHSCSYDPRQLPGCPPTPPPVTVTTTTLPLPSPSDSDDDDDERSGPRRTDSRRLTADRQLVVDYLATATVDELACMDGCSKKKAEVIVAQRPYANWTDAVRGEGAEGEGREMSGVELRRARTGLTEGAERGSRVSMHRSLTVVTKHDPGSFG